MNTPRSRPPSSSTKLFDKKAELAEKSSRFAELAALLNMDDKGDEVIDGGRDEDDMDIEPERDKGGFER